MYPNGFDKDLRFLEFQQPLGCKGWLRLFWYGKEIPMDIIDIISFITSSAK